MANDREEEIERRVNERLLEGVRARLTLEADLAFKSTLNRLWAANGAGVGILANAKVSKRKSTSSRLPYTSLVCFHSRWVKL